MTYKTISEITPVFATKIDASDRVSAHNAAKAMLFNAEFFLETKTEKYAARSLGASMQYLKTKGELTLENLSKLWKNPEKFFAEIKDDQEIGYGLTGIYQLIEEKKTDVFEDILTVINQVLSYLENQD